MRRSKPQPIRNKLDLGDPVQVRLIKKRLHLSETELTAIVARIGNSISAISKEALALRAHIPEPPQLPPAAVITTVAGADPAASDNITIGEQAP